MSLALYRKYRPGTFAEVKGQEHVTDPLRQALRSGRINHAYLFSGPRGCGKTSSARILARSLNCEQGPTPDPCGVCESCVALAPTGPGHLDVIEIDAASHGGVDDARDLRERAFFAPVSARFKIYIIDEAHMVTREGFNALLKLVEEPPPHLKFVFATTEPEKVIGTIKSRTHHYPFRLMPPATLKALMEEILASEAVPYEPAALPLVVRAGAGSARDSLSILDQLLAGADESGITYQRAVSLLGYTDGDLLDEIVGAFARRDGGLVFQAVNRVIEGGHDPRRFATDLLERFRDLVILANVPEAAANGLLDRPADELERLQGQAAAMGPAELTRAGEIFNAGLTEMRGAASPRLLLELMCARILLPAAEAGEAATLARLERLERDGVAHAGGQYAGAQQVSRPVGAPAYPARSQQGGSAAPQPGSYAGGEHSGASAGGAAQPGAYQEHVSQSGAQHGQAQQPGAYQGQNLQPGAQPGQAPQADGYQGQVPQAGAPLGQVSQSGVQPGLASQPGAQRGQAPQADAQQGSARQSGAPQDRAAQSGAEKAVGQSGAASSGVSSSAGDDWPETVKPGSGGVPSGQAAVPPADDWPTAVKPGSGGRPAADVPPAAQAGSSPAQASPAPPPPSASQAPAGAGMVAQVWPQVLEAVKNRQRVAWMIINAQGRLLGAEGNVVTVGFEKPGDVQGFLKGKRDEVVAAALGDVLGGHWRVDVVTGGTGGGQAARPSQPSPPPAPAPPPVQPTPPVQTVQHAQAAPQVQPVQQPSSSSTAQAVASPRKQAAKTSIDESWPDAPTDEFERPAPQSAYEAPPQPRAAQPAPRPAAAAAARQAWPDAVPARAKKADEDDVDPDNDADVDSDGLSGLALLQKELGGQVIQEIDHS
ncbi:DNA polymerase III subunit gamma and tau [Herbidospora mongoliensis]|uniref:DNA polymerase III subunit gamma and tau n=1 Tax=Herbidospora mongoliensis TaxID=688067 RepID=UPI000834F692|nr:DNA polymerase III subunit gamma and tau [Herbidospora mongoliensis]